MNKFRTAFRLGNEMYSIYFKSTERSDSTIRHYSLFISHSLKFHTSGSLRPKKRPV
ncbi:hypothetical protein D1AOALGA4SA_10562 [Olavius algarvensis Delta 1 endosymbiont]|nr:hypothetical protein D1AOALGA4SA_10562 [Olavius algarvensis Delta 1 endosymbiont]